MSEGLRVRTLEWGRFKLDGGAMFGVVPQTMWRKTDPPDERNRIEMAARGMLVEGDGFVLLVDCGCGDKMPAKLRDIYDIRPAPGGAEGVLAGAGLEPSDVTHVVITHLHFDHAGGCTRAGPRGASPTFPKARYLVQRRQIEWARRPTPRDRASYFPDDFEPLAEAGLLEVIDGKTEVAPGVTVLPFMGHTPGIQAVRVDAGETTYVFPSDVIPTASHLPLPFVMAYDLQPLVTLDEKRRILDEACEQGHVLVFEHDPRVAAARVAKGEKAHRITRVLEL